MRVKSQEEASSAVQKSAKNIPTGRRACAHRVAQNSEWLRGKEAGRVGEGREGEREGGEREGGTEKKMTEKGRERKEGA